MTDIEEKLRQTSQLPGVYLLKDDKGKIIYVGKAKALRNRLRSHFKAGKDEELRHRQMMAKVVDFETIVTDSELEALIMEANFVKAHRPKYNINLKDDKSYPYIRITNELYPRVIITRKIIRDGSKYYGPYTDVKYVRQVMAAIKKIFPIRTCNLQITRSSIDSGKNRVCLMYHIKRCHGPCEGKISPEAYRQYVDHITSFIEGKNNQLAEDIKRQMAEAAERQQYEIAAELRDQMRGIEAFRARQKVVDLDALERDILAVAADGDVACGLVFHVRDGKMVNRQHYYLEGAEEKSIGEVMETFVKQYYLRAELIAREIFLSESIENSEQIAQWLKEKRGGAVTLHIPQRGRKADVIEMARQNARLLVEELKLQKSAQTRISKMVIALQKDLNLENPPNRIEAFDISHIQGTETVASLVVFENGKPKKSDYRKFKIKTVQGIDDFASMAEVVERRYARILREGEPMPDLILIDGGKGQLSSAVSILKKFGIGDQPVIGLAKRLEEIFRPGLSDPQTLPKASPSLRLLQQVRDEAHRFAITFHRSLRAKSMVRSALDGIPGIGEKRRKILLQTFGSVEGIKKAGVEEIAAVESMNIKEAKIIKDHLSKMKERQ